MAGPLPEGRRRQVEALLRSGLSNVDVQRRTGVDRNTVARYRKRLGLPGFRVTADSPACRHGHPFPENVARDGKGWLYCRECNRTRVRASQQYVPAEPDAVAIDRAVAGDPPERLTPRERQAAVLQLTRQQLPASVIAERVGCSRRTVHRLRNKAGFAKAA